jgi:FMN phosphatase YigB (HAD superfamily)
MIFPAIQQAKKQIDSAELVSFDIFDTLVTRQAYKPTDLFYFIQQTINDSNDELYIQFDFPAERIKSEQIVRDNWHAKGLNPDLATLDDIYEVLAERNLLGIKTADLIKKWESKIEVETMVVYSPGAELYKYAIDNGKKVVLLSDMYLPLGAVNKMLRNHGYKGHQDFMLSSHDGVCKSDGSMYAQMLAKHNVSPEKWVHVGDNIHSDIVNAQSFGAGTVLMPKKEEALSTQQEFFDFYKYGEVGAEERAGALYAMSALSVIDNQKSAANFWWRLGVEVAGHVHVGFAAWLTHKAKEQGIDKLLFLARDGQIVEKVYELAEAGQEVKIDHDYCFASRRLFNIAAIDKLNGKDVDFILSGTTPLTAGQYLERINMLSKRSEAVLSDYGLDREQVIVPALRDKMRAVVWSLSSDIEEMAKRERGELTKYLEKINANKGRIGIVDIGWHGSMQRALEKIMTIEGMDASVTGFYFGLHDTGRKPAGNMYAYITELNDNTVYQYAVRGSVEIAELLFSADHPTIIGLDAAKPIYGSQTVTGFDAVELQAGIMAFAKTYYQASLKPSLTADICIQSVTRLAAKPTLQEVRYIGAVTHYEGFGYNTHLKGRQVVVTPNWRSLMAGRRHWRQMREDSFWKTGFAVQVENMKTFRARRKVFRIVRGSQRRLKALARKVL